MHCFRSLGLMALLLGALFAAWIAAASGAGLLSVSENSFLASTRVSMHTMMTGMQVAPQGDVDQDFIGQMIPHHRGAIDMAKAELLYGHNEQLRRIAQEIIVEQQAEIVVMQREQVSQGTNSVHTGAN
jgi:uncharacterized protein (DUF305 family)